MNSLIDEIYDSAIRDLLAHTSNELAFDRRYITRMRWRIYEDWIILRRICPKDAKILDIGAVPPVLACVLKKDGFTNITVVDPHVGNYTTYLNSLGITCVKENFLESKILHEGEAKYDVIILAEVLEHLSGNILPPFNLLRERMNPGGCLFLTTPNVRSISGMLALLSYGTVLASKHLEGIRAQYDRVGADSGYLGHVREYSSKEVVDFVESFNFHHQESKFISRPVQYCPGRQMKIAAVIERFIPAWRLFGKYVFKAV